MVGVYFYAWYNELKWFEAPTRNTPLIGKYDSADPFVIQWQIDLIKWCGFDYVVFEMVPMKDWGFDRQTKAVDTAVRYLESVGLRWTFLPDCRVVPSDRDVFEEISALIRFIQTRDWQEGLVTGPTGKPLVLVYRPLPDCARALRLRFPEYELRFPVWFPHWGVPDSDLTHERYAPFVAAANELGNTMREALIPLGYVSFWEHDGRINLYDGFCSVVPGFDDTLLGRDPQWLPVLDRKDGRIFSDQLQQALRLDPEHILVFSWNEYFETCEIEPTRESGMKYVRLMEEHIRRAKINQP